MTSARGTQTCDKGPVAGVRWEQDLGATAAGRMLPQIWAVPCVGPQVPGVSRQRRLSPAKRG